MDQYRETLGYLAPLHAGKQNYESRIFSGVRKRAEEIGYAIDRFEIESDVEGLRRLDRILTARGIRGLVISPFPWAAATLPLNLKKRSAVAIGYTLIEPELNRVATDSLHSLHMILQTLVREGYQRIGFVMDQGQEERKEFSNLAGFLIHEWRIPYAQRIPPLVWQKGAGDEIIRWYHRQTPDIIVATAAYPIINRLNQEGIRVPEDVNVFDLNCAAPDSDISGNYPNYERLGAASVEQVAGLLERGEFGLPRHPQTLLVPGILSKGKTAGSRKTSCLSQN